jgi:hypothetical protein
MVARAPEHAQSRARRSLPAARRAGLLTVAVLG